MARHKWTKEYRYRSQCVKCGMERDKHSLTPRYTIYDENDIPHRSYGKAGECDERLITKKP